MLPQAAEIALTPPNRAYPFIQTETCSRAGATGALFCRFPSGRFGRRRRGGTVVFPGAEAGGAYFTAGGETAFGGCAFHALFLFACAISGASCRRLRIFMELALFGAGIHIAEVVVSAPVAPGVFLPGEKAVAVSAPVSAVKIPMLPIVMRIALACVPAEGRSGIPGFLLPAPVGLEAVAVAIAKRSAIPPSSSETVAIGSRIKTIPALTLEAVAREAFFGKFRIDVAEGILIAPLTVEVFSPVAVPGEGAFAKASLPVVEGAAKRVVTILAGAIIPALETVAVAIPKGSAIPPSGAGAVAIGSSIKAVLALTLEAVARKTFFGKFRIDIAEGIVIAPIPGRGIPVAVSGEGGPGIKTGGLSTVLPVLSGTEILGIAIPVEGAVVSGLKTFPFVSGKGGTPAFRIPKVLVAVFVKGFMLVVKEDIVSRREFTVFLERHVSVFLCKGSAGTRCVRGVFVMIGQENPCSGFAVFLEDRGPVQGRQAP